MRERPHIVWPAAIILLLLSGAAMTFGVLIAAHSDGGAKVVEDYYQKAVTFDSLTAIQRSSDELGWSVRVEIGRDRTGSVAISDRSGEPVQDLSGTIRVERPQTVGSLGEYPLQRDPDVPGRYTFEFPFGSRGLWDLTIIAGRQDEHFSHTIRTEF